MQTFCLPCKHATYPKMHRCCRMSVGGVERYDTQHCLKMPLVLHHTWRLHHETNREACSCFFLFPYAELTYLSGAHVARARRLTSLPSLYLKPYSGLIIASHAETLTKREPQISHLNWELHKWLRKSTWAQQTG